MSLITMGHEHQDKGHSIEISKRQTGVKDTRSVDFVLEKSIFNNIFEKDIRRVFIYKKAERLAKAIHLVAPAFVGSMSLKDRINAISISIVDSAVLPLNVARTALSRELLALSSMLSIARTSGTLSTMNAEIIIREAHNLLQEVSSYEDPRVSLDDSPTLSEIAKKIVSNNQNKTTIKQPSEKKIVKDISDKSAHIKDRRETIMSVIRNKHKASIKDISTVIRGVSEKTIQRELAELIGEGIVLKQGERRWSTYSLA